MTVAFTEVATGAAANAETFNVPMRQLRDSSNAANSAESAARAAGDATLQDDVDGANQRVDNLIASGLEVSSVPEIRTAAAITSGVTTTVASNVALESSQFGEYRVIDVGTTNAELCKVDGSGNFASIGATFARSHDANSRVSPAIVGLEIYPEWFGAAADGTTDDATAIEAVLDAIDSTGERFSVRLSNHKISTTLSVPASVDFVGGSIVCGASIDAQADDVRFSGVNFSASSARSLILIRAGDNVSGWHFDRCHFDNVSLQYRKIGRRATGSGSTITTGTGVEYGTITNCEFENYAGDYTIAIAGTDGVVVDRCYIHDNGINVGTGDAIKVLEGADNTRITNCRIVNPTRDGIDIYDSTNNIITGNVIVNAGADGIDAKWSSTDTPVVEKSIISNNRVIGCVGQGFDINIPNSIIASNSAENCTGHGFYAGTSNDGLSATRNTVFATNLADSCNTGFRAFGTEDCTFSGNISINNTTGYYIYTDCVNTVLVGNQARGNSSKDYDLKVGADYILIGNISELESQFNMNMVLPNDTWMYGRNSTGGLVDLFRVTSGDNVQVGDSGKPFEVLSSSVKLRGEFIQFGVADSGGSGFRIVRVPN